MKKILVCIANYGNGQREFLLRILDEYDSMDSFDIDIIILCTTEFELPRYKNIRIRKEFYSKSIGFHLPHKHKKFLADNVDNYDIFIYTENDFLVKEVQLKTFLETSENLRDTDYVPGFIVYEERKNDEYQYLIGFHPGNCTLRRGNGLWMRYYFIKNYFIRNRTIEKRLLINGRTYFEPTNIHQGFYILTKEQFKKVLSSGNYFLGPEGGYGAIRESAASDVYYRCGVTKIISLDRADAALVHHLPDKYVNEFKHYNKREVPDMKKLKKSIEKMPLIKINN